MKTSRILIEKVYNFTTSKWGKQEIEKREKNLLKRWQENRWREKTQKKQEAKNEEVKKSKYISNSNKYK